MNPNEQSTEFKILEAAEKLFLQQGFIKTTTAQIAKEAGCNQALVHYYYRTKEHLFEKVYGEKLKEVADNLIRINQQATSFEESICNMVSMHMDFFKKNPQIMPFILREHLNGPNETISVLINTMLNHVRPLVPILKKKLDEEIEKGHIRPISLFDFLTTIISLNAGSVLIAPLVQNVLGISDAEREQLFEKRKKEVTATILASLKQK
ncbi:MAG: TetR/AcrR family transcriptional regulator [Bacteroidaceae bacterium]|jgi:TetR/AcrR family transcriptional regulator